LDVTPNDTLFGGRDGDVGDELCLPEERPADPGSNLSTLSFSGTGTETLGYTWSPMYIDATLMRDRDATGNGSIDERLYAQHDANFNVTGLYGSDGFGGWEEKDALPLRHVRQPAVDAGHQAASVDS
jgi:hypothetical protein